VNIILKTPTHKDTIFGTIMLSSSKKIPERNEESKMSLAGYYSHDIRKQPLPEGRSFIVSP
jgi:hypothetical protein